MNTFRIENGRADDNYLFSDVRIEDHWVMLGVIVEGTVSDGHGHDVEDARLTLYHDGETTPLATSATAADGSFELKPDELVVGEKYRVTAELESEDHRLVMKEKGTVVSFSRDFTYDDTDSLRLDFDCSKVASFAAASIGKGDLENCASVWHWLQLNRQVAQEIGQRPDRDAHGERVLDRGGRDGRLVRPERERHLPGSRTSSTTTPTRPAAGRRTTPYPAPWDFRKNRETHEFGHAMMNVVMGGSWMSPSPTSTTTPATPTATPATRSPRASPSSGACSPTRPPRSPASPDKYDEWGYLAGANRRMAWSPVDPASPLAEPTDYPDEEFAAAGLLRTLQGVLGGGRPGSSRSPTTCRRAGTSPTSATPWSRAGSRPPPSTPCSSASASSPTPTATGPTTPASRWAPATAPPASCSGTRPSVR